MDFKDRPAFLNKMIEMASLVGRTLREEDIEAYFKHLQKYPIDIVIKAMDQAYYSRDPKDLFNQKTMITESEIRIQAEELLFSGEAAANIGCERCNNTGYILVDQRKGQPLASPCDCLIEARRIRNTKGKKK